MIKLNIPNLILYHNFNRSLRLGLFTDASNIIDSGLLERLDISSLSHSFKLASRVGLNSIASRINDYIEYRNSKDALEESIINTSLEVKALSSIEEASKLDESLKKKILKRKNTQLKALNAVSDTHYTLSKRRRIN